MNILSGIILCVLGAILLLKGADWFMDGVRDLAPLLGISALTLGILLASLEPEEMLTAAIASLRGTPTLAVGNVLGTNIVITTLALGLSALIFPLTIDRAIRRQAIIATLISVIPVILLLTGVISRVEGLLMLLLFGVYTFVLLRYNPTIVQRLEEKGPANEDDLDRKETPNALRQPPQRLSLLGITVGGLIALAIGGSILVEGALRLAEGFGLSAGVIGATVVSLGTGAEMIALGISAARRKQAAVLVGGVIGSFAYNLLVTLGLAAVIRPLPVDVQILRIALPVMIIVHLILLALVWHGQIIRWMGGLLLVIYLAYLILVVIPAF